MKMPQISILMTTYNGAAYVEEQLATLQAQTLPFFELLISDDGSTDGTCDRLHAFRRAHPDQRIQIFDGPQMGVSKNIWSLLSRASEQSDFIAICDQDDIWMPHKLMRAASKLAGIDGPALYGSRAIYCDASGQPNGSSFHLRHPPGFRNALVQNIISGNSIVMNRAAFNIVARSNVCGHIFDWYIYQLLSGAGAEIIHDPQPSFYYRQHSRNQIGANSGLRARLRRIGQALTGQYKDWNEANITALQRDYALLDEEGRKKLEAFLTLRKLRGRAAIQELRRIRLYRQGPLGQLGLYVTAYLGRI